MKISSAAKRYAIALLSLSIEKSQLDEVKKDLETIQSTLLKNRDLLMLTKSPVVKPKDKSEVLNKVFKNNVSDTVLDFLGVLSQNKREALLLDTTYAFETLYRKHNNIISASITSAVKLSDKSKDAMIAAIKSSTDSQIELEEIVNNDLIGGFVLQIEDKLLDLSISGKLKEIKYALN